MLKITLFALVFGLVASLSCLNKDGQPVQWWVIFKVPPKTGSYAYGYYDSKQQSDSFVFQSDPVDTGITALTNTFTSFNQKNFNRVAWNDQKPNGTTSSTSAHSKGFIGVDTSNQQGFFLSHSIPQYPSFVDGQVVADIKVGQQVYGQHLSCFSLTLNEIQTIASNLLITKANIYEAYVQNTRNTENLYKLANKTIIIQADVFKNVNVKSVYGYNLFSIFKNGKLNGSIFEDGLTSFLGSKQMIVQSWGRPLQPAWCNENFKVKNVQTIRFGNLTWNQSDDHSKWVLAEDHVCLGDMNRMTSQWARGGAFYCLTNRGLINAVKQLITDYDDCADSKVLSLRTQ